MCLPVWLGVVQKNELIGDSVATRLLPNAQVASHSEPKQRTVRAHATDWIAPTPCSALSASPRSPLSTTRTTGPLRASIGPSTTPRPNTMRCAHARGTDTRANHEKRLI